MKMSYLQCILGFSQLYAAVVRAVGYGGLSMRDRPEKMGPIGELYGKGAMRGALEELTTEDEQSVLRLTPDVRRLARVILGPEPKAEAAPEPEPAAVVETTAAKKREGRKKKDAPVQSQD